MEESASLRRKNNFFQQDNGCLPFVIVVIGATGTGKSQLAVDLALALSGANSAFPFNNEKENDNQSFSVQDELVESIMKEGQKNNQIPNGAEIVNADSMQVRCSPCYYRVLLSISNYPTVSFDSFLFLLRFFILVI